MNSSSQVFNCTCESHPEHCELCISLLETYEEEREWYYV